MTILVLFIKALWSTIVYEMCYINKLVLPILSLTEIKFNVI